MMCSKPYDEKGNASGNNVLVIGIPRSLPSPSLQRGAAGAGRGMLRTGVLGGGTTVRIVNIDINPMALLLAGMVMVLTLKRHQHHHISNVVLPLHCSHQQSPFFMLCLFSSSGNCRALHMRCSAVHNRGE